MARTKTRPDTTTKAPEPPPDPPTQEVARPSPVLAWPAEWPVPELPTQKQRRRDRGLPMGPVLAGAGNGTALTATAAYSVGGPVAAAATGVVIVAGATAAVLRRRATVRASRAIAPRLRSGGGSGWSSGSGGGSNRSGSGSGPGSRSGRGGGATRPGSGRSGSLWRSGGGSSGGGTRSGPRSGSGGGQRSGSGSWGKQNPGRHTPSAGGSGWGSQKPGSQQTTKTPAGNGGKSHALKAAAARVARAAYRNGKPLVTRAGKATAKQTRRTAGAAWDGLCSLAAGVRAWLRDGRTAGLERLKAVWKRRRQQRKNTPGSPDAPAVAPTVRRPTLTTPTPRPGGSIVSGGHHFVAAATEMARAASAYQPQGMLQVGQDFAGLEEALRIHAEALRTTVENADSNWPLAPQIVDLMREIHSLQLKAAELASELQPAFRQLHDVDIARLESPRTGEQMWDVTANR